MSRKRIAWRDENGVAAVEFAIISTVLLMIMFGIIEFGRTYSQYEVLQGAAREGARRAAVRAPAGEVVAAVYDAASPFEPTTSPVLSQQCTDDTVGQSVEVSWDQSFQISIPFLPSATIVREIRGVFRCE